MTPPATISNSTKSPVTKTDLLGCWRLVEALEDRDGVIMAHANIGVNPTGFLHYLPGDRVAVTVALAGRKPMSVPSNSRRRAPVEELAESGRTFDAYAGRFSLTGDQVTHHVEISTYQNDAGTDLVRQLVLEGDRLSLHMPAFQENGQTVRRWLTWQRLSPSQS